MNLFNRTLIRGDNLEKMREFPDACVDLIATDPPFNSKRDYFVPYRDVEGEEPDVLVKAFADTWRWGEEAELIYQELLVNVGGQVGNTIEGLRKFLNETPMMAYLIMMAIRIVEMHRLLKDTGSLYLHCDPTASHYLKIIMDAIFGANNFINEIVWSYRTGGAGGKRFSKKHDIILFYGKSQQYHFNTVKEKSYTKSKHRKAGLVNYGAGTAEFFEDERGVFNIVNMRDVWEVSYVGSTSEERSHYPTQKPVELYKRIIAASSNKGDMVLDPFCGCGTTVIAAEQLDRQWIGIDLTYLAIGTVKHQIVKLCAYSVRDKIKVFGTPENESQALKLASNNPRGFEEWSITHVLGFKANAKKGADGGIDGTMKFPIGRINGKESFGTAVAQIKGGSLVLGHIRDFRTAMLNKDADLGVFVATKPPTRGMTEELQRAGFYEYPPNPQVIYPKLQYHEIQDYFRGKLPKLPPRERNIL